jgi:hypothetical protein
MRLAPGMQRLAATPVSGALGHIPAGADPPRGIVRADDETFFGGRVN